MGEEFVVFRKYVMFPMGVSNMFGWHPVMRYKASKTIWG